MKTKMMVIAALLLTQVAIAGNPALDNVLTGRQNPAPVELSLASFKAWVTPIVVKGDDDYYSAFTEKVFAWYEREKDRALPPEVSSDREKIYTDVEGPKRQTIEMEEAGEIEEGNTVGAEVYSEMQGTVGQVLEAMLYRWGKPVGKWEGSTNPQDSQFAKRADYFAPNPEWAAGGFATLTQRQNGGIAKDLFDRYIVLVRGDERKGYDVIMQYLKPENARTSSKKSFAIAIIRPIDANRTSYKISTRYQGQSYSFLGNVSVGRNNIGFNAQRVRQRQQEFAKTLKELRDTGTIK